MRPHKKNRGSCAASDESKADAGVTTSRIKKSRSTPPKQILNVAESSENSMPLRISCKLRRHNQSTNTTSTTSKKRLLPCTSDTQFAIASPTSTTTRLVTSMFPLDDCSSLDCLLARYLVSLAHQRNPSIISVSTPVLSGAGAGGTAVRRAINWRNSPRGTSSMALVTIGSATYLIQVDGGSALACGKIDCFNEFMPLFPPSSIMHRHIVGPFAHLILFIAGYNYMNSSAM